jgi:hypothetical protein
VLQALHCTDGFSRLNTCFQAIQTTVQILLARHRIGPRSGEIHGGKDNEDGDERVRRLHGAIIVNSAS